MAYFDKDGNDHGELSATAFIALAIADFTAYKCIEYYVNKDEFVSQKDDLTSLTKEVTSLNKQYRNLTSPVFYLGRELVVLKMRRLLLKSTISIRLKFNQ